MKKFFAFCLTLAMLLGMLPMAVSAAEEATPISSVDEITDLTASYVLTQDIAISAPIGAFSGSFDGDGHTVTINITATTSNAGMFTTIASGAEVKNFKIANSTVTNSSYEYTGLVAGTNNGIVSNIVAENSTVNGYTTVGGIVGKNTGTVTNCAFESGTVKKGASTDTGFGGIVGDNSGTVTLCSNNATLDHSAARSNYDYTGGIVGRNQYSGTVTHCFNSGALTDGANKSYYIGGVSGQNNGSVDSCHNTGLITSTSSRIYGVASSCTNSYYLEGCGASTGGTSKTAEEFAALAVSLGENWVDGSDGYPVLAWQDWKYSNTAIKYVVEYYIETLEEGVFELYSTNEVKAEPETEVFAGTSVIDGFTFDETNENNVLSGSASAELVLKCYYTRNSYTLTWDVGEGTITSEEGAYTAGSVKYGAAITYPEVSNPGYSLSWDQTLTTMPAADTTVTASWKTAAYPVTWDANGGAFETEDSWGDVTTSLTLTWGSASGTSCGALYGQTLGKYRWSETSTSYSNRSLPAPVHESMVFGGWYTAAEGGEEVT
ncbi:MAG: hypothetical protein IJ453_04980, partial [Oscillospiraceae bacterium]|nr:hypothetical protein [Oscillospiraceae bacterium]